MKKVSVLVMTYNNLPNLKKTLACVEKQDYPNIEIVIADGGSSDGTVEFIKDFAEKTKCEIRWVSEPDGGLYDALNKDIRRATGDYLLVCNDQYIDNSAISKLVMAIEQGDYDGAHCDLIYASEDEVKRYWHMGQGTIRQGWLPGHPTLLLKREVYEKYGNYDDKFKIAADYEFMVRILKDGEVKLAYVPEILVRMYYGGTSTSGMGSYIDSIREGHIALTRNGVKGAAFIDFIRMFRVLLQFVNKRKAKMIWNNYQNTVSEHVGERK